jgi:hypothetical protein
MKSWAWELLQVLVVAFLLVNKYNQNPPSIVFHHSQNLLRTTFHSLPNLLRSIPIFLLMPADRAKGTANNPTGGNQHSSQPLGGPCHLPPAAS